MSNQNIIKKIKSDLNKNIDQKYKKGAENYFKEKIKVYGVRSPITRKIAQKYFPKDLDKKQIFALCEQLLKTGYMENSLIALAWAYRLKKKYQKSDFKIFETWLKKYITNWATCDDLCTHTLGEFIMQYPEVLPKVFKWTKSKNRWLRRASAVIFVNPVKKKKYLKNVFQTANALLQDQDDLVQKGYGWMLNEASIPYTKKVFQYIMKHKSKMPRTALRYSIERYPQKLRKKALAK